jgi:hypothetical protein
VFVRSVVAAFKDDPRIIAWDIWNEPGNHNRNSKSYPFMGSAQKLDFMVNLWYDV